MTQAITTEVRSREVEAGNADAASSQYLTFPSPTRNTA